MVAFSVYKSSRYLFDCVATADAAHSRPYPTVQLGALEALRLGAVDVVKRLNYAEVDKLIVCCSQHPPQTVVVPATHGDIAPFEDFSKYLKVRQRAGVALLPGGQLLILSPLENDDRRLRCVLVKATHTREPSAAVAQPPHVTTIRVDEPTPASQAQSKPQAQASGALPPSAPEQTGDKRRRGRVRPRTQQEDSADTARPPSPSEAKPPSKVQATANKAAKPEGQLVLLSSLPRLEKATRIAQLRQEYEAFNELHYDVLREWSKSDPDT